jgi:hypothetical protein
MVPVLEAAARKIAAAYNHAVEVTTPDGFWANTAAGIAAWASDSDPAANLKGIKDQWNAWKVKAETAHEPKDVNVLVLQAENIIGLANFIAGVNERVSLDRMALETISGRDDIDSYADAFATLPGQVKELLPENTIYYVIAAALAAIVILVLVVRR